MNKNKTNDIKLLGTLVNADESGIIANASQVYDSKAGKSIEERVTDAENKQASDNEARTSDLEEVNKHLDTLDEKDANLQESIENISKTGEASAASNVTYNHNDSQLDASNVQQAVDEVYSKGNSNVENTKEELNQSLQDVYKKSNYNDGDDIIDFNTIHLVQDNPEFIWIFVDANERILVGQQIDGNIVYGGNIPKQVKDYVDAQINKILGTEDITETIDSLKEIEAFLKDFKNSDTLKNLLDLKADVDDVKATTDDIYKKSNPNDEEGNVIDTNSVVSIEENPEYIKAITDSVGKLIEAIGLDGVRKFFAGIDIQGVKQCVTDNPEYIAAWLDYNDKIILAIENDGNPYFGYGVPKQIKEFCESLNTAINTKIDELTQVLEEAKTDIDKKINLGENTYPSDVHEVAENPEYISVVLDAAQKILEAYGVDGVKRLFTTLEIMGTRMSVEDNPEFIKVDIDREDKILGGFKIDGDYVFGAGVPTQIQEKTKEIADNLDTANAVELDSDSDGNIYATTGVDGNIEITSDDTGTVYMTYDTDKVSIEDAYEDEEGNLIVEQNKVMTL